MQKRATAGRRLELTITDYVNPRIATASIGVPAGTSIKVEGELLEDGTSWSL